MSTISASTASNTAFKVTSDTTGTLVFQTGAVPTTAISIDASQVVSIGNIAVTGATTFAAGSAAAPSITTTGDTNTGIFFPAANTIAASTDGTERLRLDSSGNLGIGTNSPAFRLHVSGSSSQFALISTTDTTSTTGVLFGDSASNTVGRIEYVHSINGMAFFTNGTTQATLDSSGNLGIGTASPTGKLHVSGYAGGVGLRLTRDISTDILDFYQGGGVSYIDSSIAGGQLAFATAGTERMRLTSTGLGIGTTAPAYPLQVRRPGGACSLGLTMDNYGAIAELARSIFYYAIGDSTSDRTGHLFFTRDATSTDNLRLVINSAGNVGIGTASPWSQVSMSTPSGGTTGYFGVKDSVHGGDVRFGKDSGVNNNAFAGTFSNNDFLFYTNSAERARFGSGGELLLGRSTSSAVVPKLDVQAANFAMAINTTNGGTNEAIRFYNAGSVAGTISTTSSTTAYNTSSDYRLKTVLGAVANAGQRIDALQPVEYTWNDNGERARGFLAHQFQEVYASSVTGIKDAVDADGKPVYQAMQASTSEVMADLVAELQSVRARLAALESK